MDITPGTQIGADGGRHLLADIDDFQDPAPYRRTTIAVSGARGEDQIPTEDNDGNWAWGDP